MKFWKLLSSIIKIILFTVRCYLFYFFSTLKSAIVIKLVRMFYLTTVYQGLKMAVAGVGGLGSFGAIVYGAFLGLSTSGIIYIVGGSIWLTETCFILFDSAKVSSEIREQVNVLKANLKDFESENLHLKWSVSELNKVREEFVNENKKLVILLEKSDRNIKNLSKLKEKFEKQAKEYKVLLDEEKRQLEILSNQNIIYIQENTNLTNGVKEIQKIKAELEGEIKNYQIVLKKCNDHIKILEKLRDDYILENEKLQETNYSNQKQLDILREQVQKLRELYNNSRELLVNLAEAGDLFTQFNSTLHESLVDISTTAESLDETQEHFDETLNTLKNLVQKLKKSSFKDLDVNNDGIITKEEFEDGIKKLN